MFNNVNYDLEDVSSALSAASLGTGINHFPEHLLRYAAKLLSFHLLKLLEVITSTAIFPQRWKYAVITTVYKRGMKRSITNLISIHNPDIVCLCETWFDNSFFDNVSLYSDYVTATRADRKTGENGGVLILCKHAVKFEALKTSCDFACAVKLHSNQSLLIIICVYYPPRGSQYRVGWTNIHATIHQLIPTHDFKIIITCDFNEPNVDWNSFSTTNADFDVFLDFMIQYSMHQLFFLYSFPGNITDVAITNSLTYFCLKSVT